jgi:hypothetical protein
MWTVDAGRVGHEERHPTASPRDEHRLHTRAFENVASRALEEARVVANAKTERLFDFRLVGRADCEPGVFEQSVPTVDEHRHRRACAPQGSCQRPHQARGDETGTVVGYEHRVSAAHRCERRALDSRPGLLIDATRHRAVDADDLLLGRMDAARKNPRLDCRRRAVAANEMPRIDAPMKRRHDTPAGLVAPDD